MNDQSKTKQVLIQELALLRQRIKEMERLESEYQQTEEALKESEEKYRNLIVTTSEGFWFLDSDKKTIDVNQSLCDMLGYSRSEMIGKMPFDFVNDESLKIFKEQVLQITSTLHRTYEIILKKKNGINLPTIFNATSLIDKKGKSAGSFAFVTDITDRKQKEGELLKTSERLQLAIDAGEHGFWDWNLDTNDIYFSPSYYTMLGYDPGELPMKLETWINLMHPDDKKTVVPKVENCVKNALTYEVEFRLKTKDGDWKWISGKGKSFKKDIDGIPHRAFGVHIDITDQRRAEEKLRESEANYKQLFDNAPSGIYQVDFRTGKLIKANDVFCEYFGCSQEEITSISPYDIMTEESKKRFFERLNKMVLGEEVPENPEYEIIERDGKGVWVKLTTKYNYDSEGLAGANVVVHDIDDLKRAEEHLQETLEHLREAFGVTIQVMVSAIEVRDPYTAGHQIRVADLARTIATEMGLPQEKIDGIRMAGSIHDIGKLSIPAEILSKPTRLSDIEFSLIKEHSRKGYEMLKDVESPWPLAEIVYQHHERMDGSGYPRNLKGDEILMEARIMAVADVVEAMASHRPYRPGLGIGAALKEIEDNRGVLYDADVADVCLRLFREKVYQFKDDAFVKSK